MFGLNLFIAGIEKCGTTSLADWFVANGLAQYRVPGIKEPYSYAFGDVPGSRGLLSPGVLLDASAGYAFNPQAIARMPEHNTKIILCLRNHFERCFSAYSFYQTIARRDGTSAALLRTLPGNRTESADQPESLFEVTFNILKMYFPTKSEQAIRGYYEEQASNICNQSFMERVHYEMGFFLRRRAFPFFSILGAGFFTHPLKNFLVRYQASEIHLLTLDRLDTEDARAEFARDILGRRGTYAELPPVPTLNFTGSSAPNDTKPDFHAAEWDFLRNHFHHDLVDFRSTAREAGVSMKYVNQEQLDKYIP